MAISVGEYDALLMLSEEKIVNSKMKQVGRFPYDGVGGGLWGVGRVDRCSKGNNLTAHSARLECA